MQDVKIIDIDNVQWSMKDQEARNKIAELKTSILNDNTYSIEEVKTSKKWIDGKDIYRKILRNPESMKGDVVVWGGLKDTIANLNIDNCIACYGVSNGIRYIQFRKDLGFMIFYTGLDENSYIVMEYTKTTN